MFSLVAIYVSLPQTPFLSATMCPSHIDFPILKKASPKRIYSWCPLPVLAALVSNPVCLKLSEQPPGLSEGRRKAIITGAVDCPQGLSSRPPLGHPWCKAAASPARPSLLLEVLMKQILKRWGQQGGTLHPETQSSNVMWGWRKDGCAIRLDRHT